eukprot:6187127-Pleurochrysis_carterae.AAC.1
MTYPNIHEQVPFGVAKVTTSSIISYYGAKPHMNNGLRNRSNRHHVKHSCRSDASNRVAGDIPHIPPSAYTAVNACP